jgi:hypothetical protein
VPADGYIGYIALGDRAPARADFEEEMVGGIDGRLRPCGERARRGWPGPRVLDWATVMHRRA